MNITSTENANPIGTGLAELRAQVRARRAARQARLRLERDLASYATPAERLELQAILARHEAEDITDIQRIVDRQHAA